VVKHPYHLVTCSPWPICLASALFVTTFGLSLYFTISLVRYALFGIFLCVIVLLAWFFSICREAVLLGSHSISVQTGLRLGFILFLLSEVSLFFCLFWAYFHSSLSPAIELGSVWPSPGITPLDPFSLPLLNTFLLLTSSATLTCAHLFILEWDTYSCFLSFSLTLLLGAQFLCFQSLEYFSSSFTIADSVFGSAFFFLTGLHGLHVFFGLLFLIFNYLRFLGFHFTPSRHLGLVFSIWYWHFVDVVWLFVFLIVYIWGS